jgi:hypothetical protein
MERRNRDVVAALAGGDAEAARRAAGRTRRSILRRILLEDEHALHRRRARRLAIAAVAGMLLLVAPLLSDLADEVIGGGRLADLPSQLALTALLVLPAALAVLVMAWRHRPEAGSRNF